MEPDRLNSPNTCTVTLEVLGNELQFAQDPNSKHLGTTVWDASMVFVKYLEKNSRKGKFSPAKLRGKRVLELGAGCGVAGFGMALLGCDVVSTDQRAVLPLLRRNVERNTSRVIQINPGSFGSVQVAELDWGNEEHIRGVDPPFDYIIGTDIVYTEYLLEPLFQTIFALSGPKTTVMLGYEIRSTRVHEQMLQILKQNFDLKTVPRTKMDEKYQDPSIQLYIMGLKALGKSTMFLPQATGGQSCQGEQKETKEETNEYNEKYQLKKVDGVCGRLKENSILTSLRDGKLDEWERRRYGTVAARLLRDVKIDIAKERIL